jgi:succinylglutamic semialdehyde dehydrogenase
MSKENTHLIDNDWLPGKGIEIVSKDPATEETLWAGKEANALQVNEAVKAAHKHLKTWSQTKLDDKKAILKEFAKLVLMNAEDFATLISKENGKPFWESMTEIKSTAAKIPISIQAFEERTSTSMRSMEGKTSYTRYKPHGVVAVLGPFNFPAHLANGHIVPALLAGNCVIFKPSELTPAVAEYMVRLWQKAGLPPGALQLLQGGSRVGKALVDNHMIQGLFFTGSDKVGQHIRQVLSKRPQTILALEMGGNNPLVVHQIIDYKTASINTILSSFITAGQRCTCSRRLIVPQGQKGDLFLDQLCQDIKTIKVGPYTDNPEPFMGPMINGKAAQNVIKAQEHLIKLGARAVIACKPHDSTQAMITPGLIDVTDLTKKSDTEIFGPLLQLVRVKDFDSAIEEANNTAYGLAAGLFCDDPKLYDRFYHEVRAGIINWNNQLTGASSSAPFGGIGLSGNYRPSAYFAADYCSYPVACMESSFLDKTVKRPPGLE